MKDQKKYILSEGNNSRQKLWHCFSRIRSYVFSHSSSRKTRNKTEGEGGRGGREEEEIMEREECEAIDQEEGQVEEQKKKEEQTQERQEEHLEEQKEEGANREEEEIQSKIPTGI